MKTKTKIIIFVILFIGAIQFIPYGRDHSNPPVVAEPTWDNVKTREIFFRACKNCHSNKTTWPVYSNVAPISWLVQHDVNDGREEFNVSLWGVKEENKGDESAEMIEKGEMPPWYYLIAHPEAKLKENEKEELIKGLVATFGRDNDND